MKQYALRFALSPLPTIAVFLLLAGTQSNTAAAQQLSAADIAAAKAAYQRPPPQPVENPALVELGRLLFWDPRVSASGRTACVTCHLPQLGWAVNDPRSRNDSGKLTSRKSPTLLGVGHLGSVPNGWDGRNASLEAQAKASIATGSMSMRETGTPVKVEVIEERIRAIPDYVERFKAALPAAPVNIDTMVKAIAAYEAAFEPGPAPFDRWIGGDEAAISEQAKRGFALFNGKALCSSCHVGWRFTDDGFHDIGVGDGDLGRAGIKKSGIVQLQNAFKTPTLRNINQRAPFMHDGSLPSLAAVVDFYDRADKRRASISPEIVPLGLTEEEKRDLVAFMLTLTSKDAPQPVPVLPQ
jgi:cytochrome c peroxidase